MIELDYKSIDSFKCSINKLLNDSRLNNNCYNVIINLINIVEKNKRYKLYCYRIIIDNISIINNYNCELDILKRIEASTINCSIKDLFTYKIMIDIYMLIAIYLNGINDHKNSELYFDRAIVFGEKHNKYSKDNYYDSLNCAYTWKAYYLKAQGNYSNALLCYKKVINNYEKVKDDPNYFVVEKESVPSSRDNIMKLNNYFRQK